MGGKTVNTNANAGYSTTMSELIALAAQAGKPFAVCETGAGNSNGGHDIADNPTFPQWLAYTLSQAQQANACSFCQCLGLERWRKLRIL